MKAGLLFFLMNLAFGALPAFAQHLDAEKPREQPALLQNGVYVEAGGNGLFYSLNYERRFLLKGDPVAVIRVGGSYMPLNYWHNFILPVELSVINGKRNLKFEFGAGLTFLKSFEREAKMRQDGVSGDESSNIMPVFNFRLGARYDFKESPYFIRAGFTPFVFDNGENFPGFQPWGGLSFGYSFGKK